MIQPMYIAVYQYLERNTRSIVIKDHLGNFPPWDVNDIGVTFLGDVTETKWQNGLKRAWLLTRFMNGVWVLDLVIRHGSSYRCRGMVYPPHPLEPRSQYESSL